MFYTPSSDPVPNRLEDTAQRRPLPKENFFDLEKNFSAPSPLVLGLAELKAPAGNLLDSPAIQTVERALALLLLVMLSPLVLLIAAVIKFQDFGSAFYTQKRLGKNGKPFLIYKFRTMREDAEEYGPFICTDYDDERITPFGRMLRKSKLDELPQLLNILKGEMSFVGPRPERPFFHFKNYAIPGWEKRLSVRPGITGLAQISKTICHDPKEKLTADLEYISNRSLSLNLKIIAKTIRVLLESVLKTHC